MTSPSIPLEEPRAVISPPASEAAKKLAATIVKRVNESLQKTLGVNAVFSPIALDTLIDLYLDRAREEGRRESAELIEDLEATFDLRWKADMRAIKRWQEEGPGRELTWPDHADLCMWLLSKLGME